MTSSIREALDAAMDAEDAKDDSASLEETQQEVLTDEPEGDEPDGGEPEGDEPDGGEPDGGEPDGGEPDGGEPDGGEPDGGEPEGGEPEKPDTRSHKAPLNWGPKEREDWSRIPRNLQEKILEREKEIATTLDKTSTERKTAAEFTRVASAYGPVLGGVVGDTPIAAVENLFNTAATLRMGSQAEKAQTLAGLIKQFDVDVTALDAALVGQPNDDPQAAIAKMIDDKLNPIVSSFQSQQNQQTEQVRADAAKEVQEFAAEAEFLADVREDMADLIDMAAKRGETMTMRQAYGKACVLHPEISEIIKQRGEQKRLRESQQTIADKKKAASSVTGRRAGGANGGGGEQSIRDSISAAWDSQHD